METFLTGVPGSGKTAEAVRRLMQSPKDVITNISLNPDVVKTETGMEIIREDNLFSFIKDITSLLYPLRNSREELIQGAKDLGFFNKSIFWDECHMDLDKQDKEIIWVMTYHRHFNLDIVLITQQKALIATNYRKIPEEFINAVSPTLRLFQGSFTYHTFSTFSMSKGTKIGQYSVKINPDTFKYYQTGEKNSGTSSLRKKAYGYFFLFALVPLSFYLMYVYFGSGLTPGSKDTNTTKVETNTTAVIQKQTPPPQPQPRRVIDVQKKLTEDYKKEISKKFPHEVFVCQDYIIYQGYLIRTKGNEIMQNLVKEKSLDVKNFSFGECKKRRYASKAGVILLPLIIN